MNPFRLKIINHQKTYGIFDLIKCFYKDHCWHNQGELKYCEIDGRQAIEVHCCKCGTEKVLPFDFDVWEGIYFHPANIKKHK